MSEFLVNFDQDWIDFQKKQESLPATNNQIHRILQNCLQYNTNIENIVAEMKPEDRQTVLTKVFCSKILQYFEQHIIPINEEMIKTLKSENIDITDIQQISMLKHKNIKKYTDMNYSDFKKIVHTNSKLKLKYESKTFTLVSKDYPLKWTVNWEYGKQWSHKNTVELQMEYVKFFDLMMIDIDGPGGPGGPGGPDFQEIEEIAELYGFCFDIWKTFNGYHIFLVSHKIPHYTRSAVDLMTELNCDPWYILFAHKNGYKVRLTPKPGRNEQQVHLFLKTIGNQKHRRTDIDYYTKFII